MSDEKIFEGNVALVTGGSRGIGRAIVEDLARKGADVTFTYLKGEEAASELVSKCVGEGLKVEAACCDSRSTDLVTTLVEGLVESRGKIDILVCNAGVTRDQYLMMMKEEEFTDVIETNLVGAYRFTKAACRPMMTARSGCIITVSSVAAIFGIAGQANYCASKGGLVSFTRALAAELAPKGVRVNAVLPGFIETEMTAKMPRQVKRGSMERILLKRFGSAQEVSKVVSFLASPDASYIVGQAIVVDGGLTSTVS